MKQDAIDAVPVLERTSLDGELSEQELEFVIGGLARAWPAADEDVVGRDEAVVG